MRITLLYNAGTLIIICGKPMGLGTCVIGATLPALNTADVKAEFGIPHALTAVAPIIVGVPSGETPPTARKEPEVVLWK